MSAVEVELEEIEGRQWEGQALFEKGPSHFLRRAAASLSGRAPQEYQQTVDKYNLENWH